MAAIPQTASQNFGGAAGTFTVDKPTGTVAGDFLVVGLEGLRAAGSWTAAMADFPVDVSGGIRTISGNRRMQLFGRACDGSEGATLPGTFNQTDVAWSTGCLRISGVDLLNPVDVAAQFTAAVSATTQVAPSISPTVIDGLLLCMWGANSGVATYTPPLSMTEWWDSEQFNTGSSNSQAGATEQLTAAGATGTRSAVALLSAAYGALSVVLRARQNFEAILLP